MNKHYIFPPNNFHSCHFKNIKNFCNKKFLKYYYIQIPWIFKDYKSIEEIGKGVFSSVVKVIKQSTKQIYAAKIMAKESTEYFDEIEIH